MKARRLISLGVVLLAIGVSCWLWRGDPCAHLFRTARHIERLESRRPRPYGLSDHIVGFLHQSNPLLYYKGELAKEIRTLTASGRLVEFRVPYAAEGIRSDREIAKALLAIHQRTGADYWFDFDLTNRLMLVLCRSEDAARFSTALK